MIDNASETNAFPPADAGTRDILGPRVLAWLVDALLVILLLAVLKVALAILGVLTLGLGWLLFAALPAVPFLYSVLFLAGPQAATPGQQLMGLTTVHHALGRRPTGLEALASILVFTLCMGLPPLLLVALVTARHRTLQDLASGLLMIRTEPLTLRTVAWNMRRTTPAGRNA